MTFRTVAVAGGSKTGAQNMGGLVVVVSAVVGLILAACSLAAPAGMSHTNVRFGAVPVDGSAPIVVPLDEGGFTAKGLNVSFQPVTDTTQAMISIATGQLDIGAVGMGAAALDAFNAGTELKIIAGGPMDPPGHGSALPLVVRSQLFDSGVVKTVADLNGRKIALNARGTALEYGLSKALAPAKLTLADVDVVTMTFPDMLAALSTGAIDAGIVAQPLATQAVANGLGRILTDDYNQNAQNAVVVANATFLGQHRDAVSTFLEVYVEAIGRLSDGQLKDDQQALAILQKYTNTPLEVIHMAPDPYWPKDGRVNLDSLRDQQAFFLDNKTVNYTQPMDFENLIDYGALDAALKSLGG